MPAAGCQVITMLKNFKTFDLRSQTLSRLRRYPSSTSPSEISTFEQNAIALGSCRETQTLLLVLKQDQLFKLADEVGACHYRLSNPKR